MPNRILHESIKYCPKMEQLNWFEEVVYHRLTVTVDDYGCLDGRIVLLKNTLFPTREDISKDDIARAIEHMVALGLLRAYEAGGMPYLHFPAWEEEQRVRNKRRKFPAPPDEEEPLAAEDSLSAADGGALFAEEKHLTASCCQLTAGCPPESNPYPNPYPYPDSNPKFESGSVTNPYPIQAPGACAEERPRAGEQSLRHSLRCDTSLYSREAIDGAIPEDGVRPLAGESPRPASALPSEGAQEAPREDGQSLHRGCAAPKGSPWHQGELSAKLTEGFFDPSVTATPCHRSTVQHGRLAAFAPHCASLARCSVAAHCASLRVLATPALRASAVRKAHLRCSLFHWGLRTGLRFAGPVFRGCGALRAVLAPPPLRGFDDYGLFPPLAAAFVRPFFLREKGGFWPGNFLRLRY